MKAYLSASANASGYAELLIFTIEKANQITLDYGDIDEDYYCQIENWYNDSALLLVELDNRGTPRMDLLERMHKVCLSTNDIGWGYHDTLSDIYWEHLKRLTEAE